MDLELLKTKLNTLEPIQLNEMDKVSLLNRRDLKYTFHTSQLMEFLTLLTPNYYILSIDENRSTNYESLYFDYPNFDFYLKHHNGKVNRYKVRYRRYAESNLIYFEVKYKNAKGWTSKERCKRKNLYNEINEKSYDLIVDKTELDPNQLEEKLWVKYTRLTLVSKAMNERLTIDLNLNYQWEEKTFEFPNLVICEVKIGGNIKSPAVKTLKDLHIREYNMSKYCIGIALCYPHIKNNNFKPILLNLKKYA